MTNIPNDNSELPPELMARPLALVGVTGLDTLNNAVHKSIWEVIGNNNKPERAPVLFKLLPNDHKFPVIKPKRNSYEWYEPKGILKKNWMNKHLSLIPAVIVVFYDMDWNDPQWNEKIIECASRVQSIRAITPMLSPKIVVVVIQNVAPLPTADDHAGTEKAQTLCAACEIQSKSLFILPYGDHLMGYATRLETAFYDLAQQYYHNEIRNIKAHRDHLHKAKHQYLFVRHQFKIAFINELKQDFFTAQKHYVNAYNNLNEITITESNALEIKTIAGYINYKLCKLMFHLKQPKDAIGRLRMHIERYCNQTGIRDLAFEHYAWMSRQYRVFGDLFHEAVKSGLNGNQTQHPGFYYQQAAKYATERREACQRLCRNDIQYPQPDPLSGSVDYYGQHAWKLSKSNETHDAQKDRDTIRALQFNELHNGNHAMIIIRLLECAINQFKMYKCPRMKKYLLVQMAREYFTRGDYGHALTLLTRILYDYRKEKWWYIVSIILNEALMCAYITANIEDFIKLSIEALGKLVDTPDDKIYILTNLLAVINNTRPEPLKDIPLSLETIANTAWDSVLSGDRSVITVDMSTLTSCIEAKARFTERKYQVDSSVTIEIFIRVAAPAELCIERVGINVNNSELVVCELETTPSLRFNDSKIRKFVHTFVPEPQDVERNLQINSISLQLGNSSGNCTILKFNGAGGNVLDLYPEVFQYKHVSDDNANFDSIQPIAMAQIIPRKSKMSVKIEQDDPALLGEWFPIVINLTNDESTDAHHIQLSLNLVPTDAHNVEPLAELRFDINEESNQLPLLLPIGSLSTQEMFKKVFYLKSNKILSTNILMKITYDITLQNDKKKVACFKEHSIKITVVKPFEISTKYYTKRFKEVERCFSGDPFIAMPQIKILSPWPLLIENTEFEVSQLFQNLNENSPSCLNGLIVKENVIANEALCVQSIAEIENQPVNLGLYSIHWRRTSDNVPTITKTSIMLMAPKIVQSWLHIDVSVPAHGCLRSPLPFKIRFRSTAIFPHSLLLRLEANDAFMFAGNKQCTISILPDSVRELVFNFLPLCCGPMTPPRFHLSHVENSELPLVIDDQESDVSLEYLQELIDQSVPSQIFIMPQEKLQSAVEQSVNHELTQLV